MFFINSPPSPPIASRTSSTARGVPPGSKRSALLRFSAMALNMSVQLATSTPIGPGCSSSGDGKPCETDESRCLSYACVLSNGDAFALDLWPSRVKPSSILTIELASNIRVNVVLTLCRFCVDFVSILCSYCVDFVLIVHTLS